MLRPWLGDDISPAEPYAYNGLVVFAWPHEPRPGALTRPWPFGEFDRSHEPDQVGQCVHFTGAAVDAVRDEANRANPQTEWVSASDRYVYALTFRPLLPDEAGC